jgi:uncharacterized alkaline shock family protein YloU
MAEPLGDIDISNEVVGNIAWHCAARIPGVAGTTEGFVEGIAKMIRPGESSRAIRVDIKEKAAILDLFINVEEGVSIPTVAASLQRSVKDTVEAMTGLRVEAVNVHIRDIVKPSSRPDSGVEKRRKREPRDSHSDPKPEKREQT